MAYRSDLFVFTLNSLNAGRTAEELSEKLNELVIACRDTNKSGEIGIKIKIKPNSHTGQYMIEESINLKLPEFPRSQTLLFGTPEGNLQVTDPSQQSLFDARGAAVGVKDITDEAPSQVKEI